MVRIGRNEVLKERPMNGDQLVDINLKNLPVLTITGP